MSGLLNTLKSTSQVLFKKINYESIQSQQVRTKFVDRWQIRDQKRRVCLRTFGHERLLLSSVYRCRLLPPELREEAHKDILQLPRDSSYIRIRNRCYVTSRPRSLIQEFRVSRIIFRHLADYNKLSAVQRAMW